MSSNTEGKKEVIDSPVLFDESKPEESIPIMIEKYFQAYFLYGSAPSVILIPNKVKYLKDLNWRVHCMLPSKWEPKILSDESFTDLVFINPQKEVFVVPVVLPVKDVQVSLGFIIGDPSRLIRNL